VRALNVRHARRVREQRPPRAVRADGVLVGAESIHLDAPGQRGALVLHGFNDTPQSVGEFSRALHARGWTIRAPLLPHHGRADFALEHEGRADAWIESARAEWRALRTRCGQAVLIGQSMGGAIATILAAENPPQAMVLLAPYLTMGRQARLLSAIWPLWQLVIPNLVSDAKRGLRDAEARSRSLGHGTFNPRLVRELRRVVDQANVVLPDVHAPTLAVHSRSDYRIPSRSASAAFARLGAVDKSLIWREGAGHVLAADAGYEDLVRLVGEWLDQRVALAK
jgi:carboxylesterase